MPDDRLFAKRADHATLRFLTEHSHVNGGVIVMTENVIDGVGSVMRDGCDQVVRLQARRHYDDAPAPKFLYLNGEDGSPLRIDRLAKQRHGL